jgi:hypothetical protein
VRRSPGMDESVVWSEPPSAMRIASICVTVGSIVIFPPFPVLSFRAMRMSVLGVFDEVHVVLVFA